MFSLLRRAAGPSVVLLLSGGVEMSGVESPVVSIALFAIAVVWGVWAVATSRSGQAAIAACSRNMRDRLRHFITRIPLGRKKSTGDSEIQQLHRKLSECKKAHAKAALQWFAAKVEMNSERMRNEGKSVKHIRVTVRFADYKDLDLVKEIETIVKECCTQWPVEVDGSNNPTIMPDKDFKVVFDVGP